jgi:hypothetical protein
VGNIGQVALTRALQAQLHAESPATSWTVTVGDSSSSRYSRLKQSVYDADGGPVWDARPGVWAVALRLYD